MKNDKSSLAVWKIKAEKFPENGRGVANLNNLTYGLKDFLSRDFADIDKKAGRDRERALGIQIGFFNSVAELPKKRAELALLLKKNRWPQLVLCAGYAKPALHSPRRGVEEVMI